MLMMKMNSYSSYTSHVARIDADTQFNSNRLNLNQMMKAYGEHDSGVTAGGSTSRSISSMLILIDLCSIWSMIVWAGAELGESYAMAFAKADLGSGLLG
ncbi:hypothetical protein POTOM_006986 [Populus tomentosa]|uniref:Uncharacterized protein n=1 Tax=Populus tomentosa TaxID=118781 RepID=A0A8X8AU52_POPTO|nr:hypothetical protein POTOM_006986 [Populus tomentosa]